MTAIRSRKYRPSRYDPVHQPPEVLFESGDVIAVAKPAGINVAVENEAEGETSLQTRVADFLALKGEGSSLIGPRARLVHRLDKDTTGVVLFAKTPRAQSALTRDWESGRVEKTYLALVRGIPEVAAGMIDRPIGRDRAKKNRRAVDGLDPQEARTRYKVLESFQGGRLSLVEAKPLTGRTHQIRVHLASIGNPLAVDPLYGERDAPPPVGISRLTLHALELELALPTRREKTRIEAPLSPDFQRALDALRGARPKPDR